MNKTYIPKEKEIKRTLYLIDAKDKILGRLATRVARILRGKHKAEFSPHLDAGDGVIIINASKIKVSGRKLSQKIYRRYSGYPGGQKEITLSDLLRKRPETVFKLAVRRMLPRGPLGKRIFRKLKVYPNEEQPHSGQNPKIAEL